MEKSRPGACLPGKRACPSVEKRGWRGDGSCGSRGTLEASDGFPTGRLLDWKLMMAFPVEAVVGRWLRMAFPLEAVVGWRLREVTLTCGKL